MAESNTENGINEKKIKISLSQLIKFESFLAAYSVGLETKMSEDKKSYAQVNTILKTITEIRSQNKLSADDGY